MRPGALPGDPGCTPAFKLPEFYAVTAAFVTLRIAERFGIGDPFEWWERLTLPQRQILWAYERIRGAQD